MNILRRFYRKDECESVYKFNRVLGRCGGGASRPCQGGCPGDATRSGSFATVKLATHRKEGTTWAVKIIEKDSLKAEDEEALKTEVAVLEKVSPTARSVAAAIESHAPARAPRSSTPTLLTCGRYSTAARGSTWCVPGPARSAVASCAAAAPTPLPWRQFRP